MDTSSLSPDRVEKLIKQCRTILEMPGQSSAVIRDLTATIENLTLLLKEVRR